VSTPINLTFVVPLLAIGGRFEHDQISRLACDLNVRAVIDLRLEACDDREILARHGIAFLRLPTEDHGAIAQEDLDRGVSFASAHIDRGERVFVHCEHGIGRSATLGLCFLAARGIEPLAALELAKTKRPLVSPSPPQYEAWVRWLVRHRICGPAGAAIPSFDAFEAIAYRHLTGAV
jgi:hypothetical protein